MDPDGLEMLLSVEVNQLLTNYEGALGAATREFVRVTLPGAPDAPAFNYAAEALLEASVESYRVHAQAELGSWGLQLNVSFTFCTGFGGMYLFSGTSSQPSAGDYEATLATCDDAANASEDAAEVRATWCDATGTWKSPSEEIDQLADEIVDALVASPEGFESSTLHMIEAVRGHELADAFASDTDADAARELAFILGLKAPLAGLELERPAVDASGTAARGTLPADGTFTLCKHVEA